MNTDTYDSRDVHIQTDAGADDRARLSWAARELVPLWLRAAGMDERAACLESLPMVTNGGVEFGVRRALRDVALEVVAASPGTTALAAALCAATMGNTSTEGSAAMCAAWRWSGKVPAGAARDAMEAVERGIAESWRRFLDGRLPSS